MQDRPIAHLVAVFVGGVLGSATRLGLDTLMPHANDQIAVSTLLINIVGSFVLGVLTTGIWTRDVPSVVKAAIGPGFLGSFTTFSAMILSVVLLSASGPDHLLLGVAYLVVTLALGFAAALLGLRLGPRSTRGRARLDPETGE
ncbi:CrcB family protein [Agreia sp. COWG]|uniref:FluC/FEX family fluoride channel n=1 Tax=Agreia sp. COWG TaxID=2773266 RepID=UPI001925869B|nr:CrcB family protein [Agreia sp. COWG]CAD6002244.1 Putative fluoride ion transporter CrcB [Agreia sp. COWG]